MVLSHHGRSQQNTHHLLIGLKDEIGDHLHNEGWQAHGQSGMFVVQTLCGCILERFWFRCSNWLFDCRRCTDDSWQNSFWKRETNRWLQSEPMSFGNALMLKNWFSNDSLQCLWLLTTLTEQLALDGAIPVTKTRDVRDPSAPDKNF